MRTKTLLGAAILAASLATSMAQVYSLNVVGYVNYPIKGAYAYNLIANPLNNANNNITNVLPASAMKEGCQIMRWDVSTWDFSPTMYTFSAGAWDANFNLAPGEGVFVVNPDVDTTNTWVGDVVQSTVTRTLVGGYAYNCIGSTFPIAGNMTNALVGLTPNEGDQILKWDVTTWDFSATLPTFSAGAWAPQVDFAVGEGFFYVNTGSDIVWSRTSTVP